ncbi:MAG: hypothetical protein AAFY88_03130 [Acidobacteriota bacterium]
MRKALTLFALASFVLLSGCADPIEDVDSGGVVLEVEFDNSVFRIGVNDTELVTLNTVTIDSISVLQGGQTSSLMNVRLETIELTYSRTDTGSRVPPAFVYQLTGSIPVDGTLTFNNLPIMTAEQLQNPPLSDLLFENGAVDRETGAQIIKMNVTIRVFGTTLGGTDVVSAPATQTFEFVPSLITPT